MFLRAISFNKLFKLNMHKGAVYYAGEAEEHSDVGPGIAVLEMTKLH